MGCWYVSNESGQSEVYVRGFATDFSSGSASVGGSVLVSRGGGIAPRWRGDGREIYYLAPDGKMMAVAVGPGQEFHVGTPTALFQTPAGAIVGDVTDGREAISPYRASRVERIGAVHGRVELDGGIEEVNNDPLKPEGDSDSIRNLVLLQALS